MCGLFDFVVDISQPALPRNLKHKIHPVQANIHFYNPPKTTGLPNDTLLSSLYQKKNFIPTEVKNVANSSKYTTQQLAKKGFYSPFQFFYAFFKQSDYLNKIPQWTNIRMHQKQTEEPTVKLYKTWKDIDGNIFAIICIIKLLIGFFPKPIISEYWDEIYGIPCIKNLIQRDIYLLIVRHITTFDPENTQKWTEYNHKYRDKCYKV